MNTKIFSTAARHALIDMTMFDVFDISDKVGVSRYIEEASSEEVLNLFESILHSNNDFEQKQLLESNYIQSLKQKNSGIINEIILNDGRNNILMEAEGEENTPKLDPNALGKVLLSSGVTGAGLYYGHIIMKYGPEEARRQLARVEASSITGYEQLKRLVNWVLANAEQASANAGESGPKFATNIKDAGQKIPSMSSYKKAVDKYLREFDKLDTYNKQLASGYERLGKATAAEEPVIDKEIKKIERNIRVLKIKLKVDPARIDKARGQSLVDPIKQAKKTAGDWIRKKGPKYGAIGAGIIASIFAGHYVWQKFLSSAARSCSKIKFGKQKDICIVKFKIAGAEAAIKKIQSDLPKCKEHSNPEKCNHALQTDIWNWNRRKHKYISRLAKLTGSQKPPKDASGGSDIFQSRVTIP